MNKQPNQKPGLAAREAATALITRIVDDGRGLDGLMDTRHGPSVLRSLNDADVGLVRAIVTSAMRHRGEIEYALSKVLDRPPPKRARHLIHTLHVAAAQILFLDVPDSAAVDLAVTAIRADQRSTRFASLANAILRRLSREKENLLATDSADGPAVANLAPWLKKRLRKAYGKDRLAAIARQHMLEPVIDISVKSKPEYWATTLGGVHLFGKTVRVNRTGKLEDWPGYKDGEWWVQDAAASLPVHLMGDLQDKQVADLCAAPGGKTAQLVLAGAKVTAVEASSARLERLAQNLDRLKLDAELTNTDFMVWETETLFDAILLDAPCSSTGTIRRHPDVQWAKTAETVDELAGLQRKMIEQAVRLLKPAGMLLFANCSIDRAEGEDVIASVANSEGPLSLDPIEPDELYGLAELVTRQGTVRTLPCHMQSIEPPQETTIDPARFSGLDGFFAARFIKDS